MDEVGERGPEAAEQARHADRHARDLVPGRKVHRLDSFGHEVGAARDRGETQVRWRGSGELAQERANVGLVAGALPPEHVGVEDDERRAHAAASR